MLKRVFKHLWRDQRGIVHTTDIILATTLLGLGVIVGLACLRNQVVQEFCDIGGALGALDQGYAYEGRTDTQQRDYFQDNFPGQFPDAASLDWLGVHEAAGSDYTDSPNVDGSITFPGPAAGNATPGEN